MQDILGNIRMEDTKFEEDFEYFWSDYPLNDKWESFPITRVIRSNKKRSKELYMSLRREGISNQLLCVALANEIATRKKRSISSKGINNELTYMQSPAVWLNNRTFESWIQDDGEAPSEELYGKELS